MAEYIDREAVALKVKRHLMPNADVDGTVSVENAERYFLNLLAEQPTSDVVEVVRCKDCKYSTLMYGTYVCNNTQSPWFNDEFDINLEANDFCSFGIRKEGAEK